MTIHSEHPFLPPPGERDLVRQLRGRLPAPVTIVTTGSGPNRVGLTVSSILIVNGDPASVVVMVDPDSDLGAALAEGVTVAVSVLTQGDGPLADVFAGVAPAPGGPFTMGSWRETEYGPVRAGVSWLGAGVTHVRQHGWALQATADIERIELMDAPALIHQRGRYRV